MYLSHQATNNLFTRGARNSFAISTKVLNEAIFGALLIGINYWVGLRKFARSNRLNLNLLEMLDAWIGGAKYGSEDEAIESVAVA